MSEPQSYKNRTVQVRSSARAHLAELRQQRLSRRNRAVYAEQPCAVEPAGDVSLDAPGEQVTSAVQKPCEPTAVCEDISVQEHEAIDDLAVENAAMSEMAEEPSETCDAVDTMPPSVECEDTSETPELDTQAGSESDVQDTLADPSNEAEEVGKPEQADTPDVAASDLETLPGAGPGLVWMLQKCGINSLVELAEATPEKLSNDLGVVGQILDVSQWIEYAKSA